MARILHRAFGGVIGTLSLPSRKLSQTALLWPEALHGWPALVRSDLLARRVQKLGPKRLFKTRLQGLAKP